MNDRGTVRGKMGGGSTTVAKPFPKKSGWRTVRRCGGEVARDGSQIPTQGRPLEIDGPISTRRAKGLREVDKSNRCLV